MEWFDEGRIEIGEKVIGVEDVMAEQNGCEYREHPSN